MTEERLSKIEKTDASEIMSPVDFARLGDGEVAYIRQLDSGEATRLFPALKGIPEGIDLYALVSADGTPLSLRDNRSSAIADAIESDLQAVSVH
ncbi:MAG: DUF1150 domain-containing protein [Hyphomicrobiales bacterium]|nr:DUF1150 domain-containing protein [Hyphomicrobiales bacterium]